MTYEITSTFSNDFPILKREYEKMGARIDYFVELSHGSSVAAGWYKKEQAAIDAGLPVSYIINTKLMLIVSELSEALEGLRKNSQDDKLPHRKMIMVELADAAIRLFDLAGFLESLPEFQDDPMGACFMEKFHFNQNREDHKIENREKEGGKQF